MDVFSKGDKTRQRGEGAEEDMIPGTASEVELYQQPILSPVSSRVLKKEVTGEWTHSSARGACGEKAAHRKFFC